MTIFVSISSYCDSELIPTIEDCVRQAFYPSELRFGICWQHQTCERDPTKIDVSPATMRVVDIPHMEAKGCCWARTKCQELYDGEDWFLQLDSHHRFANGWDKALYEQAEMTGSSKPILGSYASQYEVGPPETLFEAIPQVMMVTRCTPDGVVLFRGGLCCSWLNDPKKKPERARFVSGHYLFAPGSFVTDVPADAGVYFTGEELILAARAFSHGYDLFHPSRNIIWHEYTRKYRSSHWDHHSLWHVTAKEGELRVLELMSTWPIGKYEFGTIRSREDYENYTGLDFTNWTASDASLRGEEPKKV